MYGKGLRLGKKLQNRVELLLTLFRSNKIITLYQSIYDLEKKNREKGSILLSTPLFTSIVRILLAFFVSKIGLFGWLISSRCAATRTLQRLKKSLSHLTFLRAKSAVGPIRVETNMAKKAKEEAKKHKKAKKACLPKNLTHDGNMIYDFYKESSQNRKGHMLSSLNISIHYSFPKLISDLMIMLQLSSTVI